MFPVFQLTETPTIISKGQFGASLIVELSYSHEGLEQWLTTLKKPYPLVLADANWLLRSPDIVKLLIEQNIPVGLLGAPNENYLNNDALLKQQLAIFQKSFQQLPLWFATRDYLIDETLQQTLYASGINLIAPTYSINSAQEKLADGDFISIPLHREETVSFEKLNQFIKAHSFITIEQNLLGYTFSTKRYP